MKKTPISTMPLHIWILSIYKKPRPRVLKNLWVVGFQVFVVIWALSLPSVPHCTLINPKPLASLAWCSLNHRVEIDATWHFCLKKIPGHGGDCMLCFFLGGEGDDSIGNCEEGIHFLVAFNYFKWVHFWFLFLTVLKDVDRIATMKLSIQLEH